MAARTAGGSSPPLLAAGGAAMSLPGGAVRARARAGAKTVAGAGRNRMVCFVEAALPSRGSRASTSDATHFEAFDGLPSVLSDSEEEAAVQEAQQRAEDEPDSPFAALARNLEHELFSSRVLPVSSPKRWVPPWRRTGSSPRSPTSPKLFPLSPKRSAREAMADMARAASAKREPQLMAQVLNRIIPLEAHEDSPVDSASRSVLARANPMDKVQMARRAGTRLLRLARNTVAGPAGGVAEAPASGMRRRRSGVMGTTTTGASHTGTPRSSGCGPFMGSLGSDASVAMAQAATPVEVAAFRASLARSFGNLTRALRAMKNASGVAQTQGCLVDPQQKKPSQGALTKVEFEWCVTSHLKFGDKRMARKLFIALDRDKKGEVGLWEIAQPPARSDGLMSVVDLRRRLLDRHRTLGQAFRELEDHMAGKGVIMKGGKRAIRLAEFVEALSFFGLESHQASHFFGLMDSDGNGSVTLDEFSEALLSVPPQVLLSDLRQRLLERHSSLSAAFKELTGYCSSILGQQGGVGTAASVGTPTSAGSGSVPSPLPVMCESGGLRLQRLAFERAAARLGVGEAEANELFKIIDEDGSGEISIEELRDALRAVAPRVDLEGFWHRLVAEWPEVAALARDVRMSKEGALFRLGLLLSSLLPEETRQRCQAAFTGITQTRRERPQLPTNGAQPLRPLVAITAEAFDGLAARLDVARDNASELFGQVVRAAAARALSAAHRAQRHHEERSRPMSPPMSPKESDGSDGSVEAELVQQIYLEDFSELLQLWTENPAVPPPHMLPGTVASTENLFGASARGGDEPSTMNAERRVRQAVAPAQAAIAALKAELRMPFSVGRARDGSTPRSGPASPASTVRVAAAARAQRPPAGGGRRPSKRPMLPWRGSAGPSRGPTPILFGGA